MSVVGILIQDDVPAFLKSLGDVAVETAIGAFNELYRYALLHLTYILHTHTPDALQLRRRAAMAISTSLSSVLTSWSVLVFMSDKNLCFQPWQQVSVHGE
jgi:hypothetical protein